MYIPAHFAVDDAATRELLARHGAADLVTLTADGLLATMLPFAYEPAAGDHGALLAGARIVRERQHGGQQAVGGEGDQVGRAVPGQQGPHGGVIGGEVRGNVHGVLP